MSSTGQLTSTAWGPHRLSTFGQATNMSPNRVAVGVPATNETNHRYQLAGSTAIGDSSYDISDGAIIDSLVAALDGLTAYPRVDYVRGTAGGECHIIRDVRALSIPEPQQNDEVAIRSVTFAAGENSQYRYQSNGTLFDYTMAHSSGVTAPVNGTAVQVGAVTAAQSLVTVLGCLDFPAQTTGTFDAKLQSATDSAFTTPNDRHTFTQITTAAYELATVAGAITDTWWRLSITGVGGGGTYFPFCCMAVYTT